VGFILFNSIYTSCT